VRSLSVTDRKPASEPIYKLTQYLGPLCHVNERGIERGMTFTLAGVLKNDFVVSGSNVVVGPSGINSADCGTVAAPKTENITVTASQS